MEDVKEIVANTDQIVVENEIKKKLLGAYDNYRKTMLYLSCDIPIEALCLSKSLQNLLIRHGITRVHHVFDFDFTKIEVLGDVRRGELAASLDKFIPMGL